MLAVWIPLKRMINNVDLWHPKDKDSVTQDVGFCAMWKVMSDFGQRPWSRQLAPEIKDPSLPFSFEKGYRLAQSSHSLGDLGLFSLQTERCVRGNNSHSLGLYHRGKYDKYVIVKLSRDLNHVIDWDQAQIIAPERHCTHPSGKLSNYTSTIQCLKTSAIS